MSWPVVALILGAGFLFVVLFVAAMVVSIFKKDTTP